MQARLLPGERVIYCPRLAPISLIPVPALFAFFALITIWIPPLAVILFGVAVTIGAIEYIRYRNTEFALTDRRILAKAGWLSHRSSEVLLIKVESIHVDQNLSARTFGFGSVVVTGTGGSKEVIANIDKPFDFYRHLQEQLAAAKAQPGASTPS